MSGKNRRKNKIASSGFVDNDATKLAKRRNIVEILATVGLILIAIGLLAPFYDVENIRMLSIYKWIYAPGALLFTVARAINVNAPDDSLRVRRLRRLEFWAGFAFVIAAFFWFYNDNKYIGSMPGVYLFVGPLKVLRETIMFSMAGAVIQLIASWMIAFRLRKEEKNRKNTEKE